MTAPKIVLSLICRDNEATLPRLLESLAESKAVQGVVAADTGSEDATTHLLRSWGATVTYALWRDDYAYARNAALALVEPGAWVLSLDSDEWVEPGFGDRLREAIGVLEAAGRPELGLSVWMRNLADSEGYANVLPMFAPRVFKNLPGTRWVFPIHEQVHRDGNAMDFAPNNSLVVTHDGYLKLEFEARGKYERNARILEKAIADEPDQPWHRYNLGETYFSRKLLPEALEQFERCIALSEEAGYGDRIMAVTSRMRACGLLLATGHPEEAMLQGKRLVAEHPGYAEAATTLALVHSDRGEFYAAAELYERALAIGERARAGEIYPYIGDESLRGWRSAIYQGRAYAKASEYIRAVECYGEASRLGSPVADPLIEGAACFAAVGRVDLAGASLDDAEKIFPGEPRAAKLRVRLAAEASEAGRRFRETGVVLEGGIGLSA